MAPLAQLAEQLTLKAFQGVANSRKALVFPAYSSNASDCEHVEKRPSSCIHNPYTESPRDAPGYLL